MPIEIVECSFNQWNMPTIKSIHQYYLASLMFTWDLKKP